jgi:hypothetical protein
VVDLASQLGGYSASSSLEEFGGDSRGMLNNFHSFFSILKVES